VDTQIGNTRVALYLASHAPSFPRGWRIAYSLFRSVNRLLHWRMRFIGREHVPDGPCLIIASHEGGETGALAAALPRPLHVLAGETVNFAGWFGRMFCRMLGMLPLRESLAFLSREEVQTALAATRRYERRKYEKVAERLSGHSLRGAGDLRRAVACLLQGHTVVVYPQGLFTRGVRHRQAGGGWVTVAREYERVSGMTLSIVPVQAVMGDMVIRRPFTLREIPAFTIWSGDSRTQYFGSIAMARIAGIAHAEWPLEFPPPDFGKDEAILGVRTRR
jgi:1-acyl-sn-glycerol-3-phosphate acyltransferase